MPITVSRQERIKKIEKAKKENDQLITKYRLCYLIFLKKFKLIFNQVWQVFSHFINIYCKMFFLQKI